VSSFCCDKPAIGATVHYVSANYLGEVQIPCLPAIVTDHCDDDELELFAIDHGDTFTCLASHSHHFDARTWHSANRDVCAGRYARR